MTQKLSGNSWEITEAHWDPAENYSNETVFSLANGYLGTRGTFEEGYEIPLTDGMEGTFINGFYESEPIRYGEFNYGFPQKSQSMLNVCNAKIIRVEADGETFNLYKGKILSYRRTLFLKEGILTRTLTWETRTGKKLELTFRRLVSFTHSHLMVIDMRIRPLNFSGSVRITSGIQTNVRNHTRENNPLIDYGPYGRSLIPESRSVNGNKISVLSRIKNNGFYLYTCTDHRFCGTDAEIVSCDPESDLLSVTFQVSLTEGTDTALTKYIVYTTDETDPEKCTSEGERFLREGRAFSFDELAAGQEDFLHRFWAQTDVTIDGDDALEQGLHFNMYHLLQSTGRDAESSVGAKGLSGEGYEGHVFWDTEMYIIPFYTHTCPQLTRNLLMYRYNKLDAARNHARELGHKKGALYPWRTINGDEASAYYPLGSAQYHINGDIAYAINQYARISGDTDFLYHYGLEILCEISRVFADVGHFCGWRGGKYVINCVTGPDEYNAIVDNNFYTNLGARETLRNTLYWLKKYQGTDPEGYAGFVKKLSLTEDEFRLWQKIIDNMYFGRDEKLNIYTQDDTFMQKKPWDPETDKEKKGSLLYVNFHPLYVFRFQMCKQADTPLALLLYNHEFTAEDLRSNYEFYSPRTLNHSSLSKCIFAIIESRLGKYGASCENLITSARMDLDDRKGVRAGIHCANMAGSWMTLTYGIAGMNTTDGTLKFSPFLPEKWNSYSFRIAYQGSAVKITVNRTAVTYELAGGTSVRFMHNGRQYSVNTDRPEVSVPYGG